MVKMTLEKSRIDEIGKLHDEIVGHLKTSLKKAIRIGELLTEQKASLKHGEFTPWIETNLPFTDRTAQNYMRVYRERDRLKTETVSDLKSAYRLLAEPKDNKNTMERAADLHEEMKTVLPRLKGEIEGVDSFEDALRIRKEVLEVGQKNAEMLFDIDMYIGTESKLIALIDALNTDYYEATPVGLIKKREPTKAEWTDYFHRIAALDKFVKENLKFVKENTF